MIKHAKAGDIVYELVYDDIDKTCEIFERIVRDEVFDYKIEHMLDFMDERGDWIDCAHYENVFKSPKAAHNAYLRVLANELKTAKQTIAKVESILQQLRDAQAKY